MDPAPGSIQLRRDPEIPEPCRAPSAGASWPVAKGAFTVGEETSVRQLSKLLLVCLTKKIVRKPAPILNVTTPLDIKVEIWKCERGS